MSNYRFDFNQADATLYEMNRINGEIKNGLLETENYVEKTLANWRGDVKEQYTVSKKIWNQQADMMTVYLEQARKTLLEISDNYGTTEQIHAKLWNDVRGG